MKKVAYLCALALLALLIILIANPLGVTRAESRPTPTPFPLTLPASVPARGLVFAGLEIATDGSCPGEFRVVGTNHCTHGPDAAPAGVDVSQEVLPQSLSAQSATTQVVCDGDGVTGSRFQVLYVHGSDKASRLSTFLSSFRSWVAGADAIVYASANETGGGRNVRFVTDTNCNVVVLDVQLPLTGAFNFGSMETALQQKGYNRTDRKYLAFTDVNLYCGLTDLYPDDQPGQANLNNQGPMFSRLDNGCWGASIAAPLMAHELMHNLGAVQNSTPHASGGGHCTDEWDLMCYSDSPAYPTMQYLCPDSAHNLRFDCNHDDYFSTAPTPGSYLDTHWNAANSSFLIVTAAPPPTPTPVPFGPGTYQDKNPAVKYAGTWSTVSNANASGGTFHQSKVTGSTAKLSFTGSKVSLMYIAASNRGQAQVYIDGTLVATLDEYSATTKYGQVWVYLVTPGLPHTIQINVTGTKNAKATGYLVTLDKLVISP